DLGERIGVKEQQIQQYEATDYASASFTRIREVVDALGVLMREDLFMPNADVSADRLLSRMQSLGIDRSLLLGRILPRPLAARLQSEIAAGGKVINAAILQAASVVGRIYNLTAAAIFGTDELRLNAGALEYARFKLPTKVDERRMRAYTVYA